MKITDVRAHLMSAEIPEGQRWYSSLGYAVKRDMVLVEIRTDKGITGFGEANHGTSPKVIASVINDKLRPLAIDQDPFYIEKLTRRMLKASIMLGHKGAAVLGLSGVELALWDIVGKALNAPAFKLLGAFQDRVPAYAGGLSLGWKEPDLLAEEVGALVSSGFRAAKIRIGQGVEADLKAVAAVRKTIGDDVRLMVDANGGYGRIEAKEVARGLKDFNVYWFEEPLPAWDIDGLSQLAADTEVAVAGGENEYLATGFYELISRRGVDIAQPDVSKCGGLLEGKKIAALAEAANIPCIPHIFGTAVCTAANAHLLGCIPNAPLMEYDVTAHNPLKNEIVSEPILVRDGWVTIPDRPGLGVDILPDAIERYPFVDGSAYVQA